MFDLSIWEIAIVAVVAILVVGPRELPRALATAGKWLRKFRAISNSLRSGLDDIIRETEMQEMEGKWAQQNKQIMAKHPNEMLPLASDDMDFEDDYDVTNIGDTAKIDKATSKTKPSPKTKSLKATKAKSGKVTKAKSGNAKSVQASKTKNPKANKAKSVKIDKARDDQ